MEEDEQANPRRHPEQEREAELEQLAQLLPVLLLLVTIMAEWLKEVVMMMMK